MDKLYQDGTKCPQIENLEKITPEQVITEIADVHLMIRQLMVIYGLDACLKEYDRKQRRLLRRMDKETGGDYRKEKDNGNKG